MKKVLIFALLICLFGSCDLFNNPVDPDFVNRLDDEIAWANAAKLTVTVGFPAEWGSSPQRGTGFCGDTRLGYPFDVEFGVMPGYGFEGWIAFPSDKYDGLDKTLGSLDEDIQEIALGEDVVEISEYKTDSGSHAAKVIIKTTIPITLVPWCGDRPRVIYSNPPQGDSGFLYTRNQEIRISFSMPLDSETVVFGENTIMIHGHNISNGQPWSGNGDLREFYNNPVFNAIDNYISIVPHGNPSPPPTLLFRSALGWALPAVMKEQ